MQVFCARTAHDLDLSIYSKSTRQVSSGFLILDATRTPACQEPRGTFSSPIPCLHPFHNSMSAGQRLKGGLQTSGPQTICWRCSLKQQQRWRSSSARVFASSPLQSEDSFSPSRTPKDGSSPGRRRVEFSSTRAHRGLPQDIFLPTTFSIYGDTSGGRRAFAFNRKTPPPSRSAGMSPADVTRLSQRVWWNKAPLFAAAGPPVQRSWRNAYTCSAVGQMHFANS